MAAPDDFLIDGTGFNLHAQTLTETSAESFSSPQIVESEAQFALAMGVTDTVDPVGVASKFLEYLSKQTAVISEPGYAVMCVAGCAFLFLYAREKYDRPTYNGISVGNLAPFPPRLLASAHRYNNGLLTYLSLIMLTYAVFCFFGPGIIGLTGGGGEGGDVKEAAGKIVWWPLTVATILVGSGVASDTSALGKIEAKLRTWAHGAVAIPMGIKQLAEQLAQVDVEVWAKQSYSPPSLLTEAIEKSRTAKPHVASFLSAWAQGIILFHTLRTQLKAVEYRAVKSQDDNKNAMKLLKASYDAIVRDLSAGEVEDGNALNQEMLAFRDNCAMLLASELIQAECDLHRIKDVIPGIDHAEAPGRPPYWEFATIAGFGVALTGVMVFLLLHLIPQDRIVFGSAVYKDETYALIVSGIVKSAVIMYLCALIFSVVMREYYACRGLWRETAGSHLRVMIFAAVASSLLATNFGDTLRGFESSQLYAQLWFNFFASAWVSYALLWHCRATARSATWFGALFSPAVLLVPALSVIVTAFLQFSSGAIQYANPMEALPALGPSCLTAFLMALSFALIVRSGRWLQLQHRLDAQAFLPEILRKLSLRLREVLAKPDAPAVPEGDEAIRRIALIGGDAGPDDASWPNAPQPELGNMTPLEALRYPVLWDRLIALLTRSSPVALDARSVKAEPDGAAVERSQAA